MHEIALVGKQQQSAGVFVEPANAGDLRVARAPAGRQQRVDVRPLALVVGADQSHGLVHEKQQAGGVIERLSVHADVRRFGLGAAIIRDLVAHRHPATLDPAAGFPAGAVAEVGEELVEPAHQAGISHEKRPKAMKRIGAVGRFSRLIRSASA